MVCVTSGKGGVGKTTTSASLAMGLAERGFRVCAVDFDIGLRNLDLHLGCERRIVFDFVNVIQSECKLHQALIKDRHQPNLFMLAASQTRDKTALTGEGVELVIDQLRSSFDYIVCDSPAGIENGATQAMRHADIALVCTNPELSSVRDSDKMLSIVASKSKRAELGQEPVQSYLLITRYHADRVAMDSMLGAADIQEMLGVPLLGVVPESADVLKSTNVGRPVILQVRPPPSRRRLLRRLGHRLLGRRRRPRRRRPRRRRLSPSPLTTHHSTFTLQDNSDVALAYQDLIKRFLGEECGEQSRWQ